MADLEDDKRTISLNVMGIGLLECSCRWRRFENVTVPRNELSESSILSAVKECFGQEEPCLKSHVLCYQGTLLSESSDWCERITNGSLLTLLNPPAISNSAAYCHMAKPKAPSLMSLKSNESCCSEASSCSSAQSSLEALHLSDTLSPEHRSVALCTNCGRHHSPKVQAFSGPSSTYDRAALQRRATALANGPAHYPMQAYTYDTTQNLLAVRQNLLHYQQQQQHIDGQAQEHAHHHHPPHCPNMIASLHHQFQLRQQELQQQQDQQQRPQQQQQQRVYQVFVPSHYGTPTQFGSPDLSTSHVSAAAAAAAAATTSGACAFVPLQPLPTNSGIAQSVHQRHQYAMNVRRRTLGCQQVHQQGRGSSGSPLHTFSPSSSSSSSAMYSLPSSQSSLQSSSTASDQSNVANLEQQQQQAQHSVFLSSPPALSSSTGASFSAPMSHSGTVPLSPLLGHSTVRPVHSARFISSATDTSTQARWEQQQQSSGVSSPLMAGDEQRPNTASSPVWGSSRTVRSGSVSMVQTQRVGMAYVRQGQRSGSSSSSTTVPLHVQAAINSGRASVSSTSAQSSVGNSNPHIQFVQRNSSGSSLQYSPMGMSPVNSRHRITPVSSMHHIPSPNMSPGMSPGMSPVGSMHRIPSPGMSPGMSPGISPVVSMHRIPSASSLHAISPVGSAQHMSPVSRHRSPLGSHSVHGMSPVRTMSPVHARSPVLARSLASCSPAVSTGSALPAMSPTNNTVHGMSPSASPRHFRSPGTSVPHSPMVVRNPAAISTSDTGNLQMTAVTHHVPPAVWVPAAQNLYYLPPMQRQQ
ncbi:centrosomal and chromosomal factor-like [Sycon ciliatum]|uniref:centrosomal and chromosomal factor-like n=1 Tax=Sycon ciliatum TaxID=27933 RepID=UPI0031F60F5B